MAHDRAVVVAGHQTQDAAEHLEVYPELPFVRYYYHCRPVLVLRVLINFLTLKAKTALFFAVPSVFLIRIMNCFRHHVAPRRIHSRSFELVRLQAIN